MPINEPQSAADSVDNHTLVSWLSASRDHRASLLTTVQTVLLGNTDNPQVQAQLEGLAACVTALSDERLIALGIAPARPTTVRSGIRTVLQLSEKEHEIREQLQTATTAEMPSILPLLFAAQMTPDTLIPLAKNIATPTLRDSMVTKEHMLSFGLRARVQLQNLCTELVENLRLEYAGADLPQSVVRTEIEDALSLAMDTYQDGYFTAHAETVIRSRLDEAQSKFAQYKTLPQMSEFLADPTSSKVQRTARKKLYTSLNICLDGRRETLEKIAHRTGVTLAKLYQILADDAVNGTRNGSSHNGKNHKPENLNGGKFPAKVADETNGQVTASRGRSASDKGMMSANAMYYSEINGVDLLTPQEEIDLAYMIQGGDEAEEDLAAFIEERPDNFEKLLIILDGDRKVPPTEFASLLRRYKKLRMARAISTAATTVEREEKLSLQLRLLQQGLDCLMSCTDLPPYEDGLIKTIGQGKQARDHLVCANLRLVVSIARQFLRSGLPLPDLIAEGQNGLLRAVESFDPLRKKRFSTFAAYWIKQCIRVAMANETKMIRFPKYLQDLTHRFRMAEHKLEEETGTRPTFEEVTGELNISPRRMLLLRDTFFTSRGMPRTGQLITDPSSDLLPIDEVEDSAPGTEDSCISRENMNRLFEQLDLLSDTERDVVTERYGLDTGKPKTLRELGEAMGMSREGIRIIQQAAERKLSIAMRK